MIRRLSSFLFSTGLGASLYVDGGLVSADIDRRATADAPGRSATAGMAANADKIGSHMAYVALVLLCPPPEPS